LGGLTFDAPSGDLSGPSGATRLAPQPASLLALLASRAGHVVSRDEIREHLWPEGKVEFEQGIAFAVREIRKRMEEVGGDSGLLETIPKRGLRLLGGETAGVVTAGSRGEASGGAAAAQSPGRAALLAGGALLLAVGLMALRSVVAGAPVLAVFPHAAGEDGASARVAAALTTELTTVLTDVFEGRLGVVGPTGTSAIGGPDDTGAARERLGACLVMSGSVRMVDSDRVVVFTQIVRTSDRVHVWAVQDTVASERAGAAAVATIVEGTERSLDGC
jgi:DNA-binding winged helix-turn-helix (wHTH) protein